jgi:hypothetical protein
VSALPEFRLAFADVGALQREIASNIRYGRVFLQDVVVDAPVLSEGVLVLVHPLHGRELRLSAQIVMVNADGPMRGSGLALRAFVASEVGRLEAFANDNSLPEPVDADSGEPLQDERSAAPNAEQTPERSHEAATADNLEGAAAADAAETVERACEAEAAPDAEPDCESHAAPADETTPAFASEEAPDQAELDASEPEQAADELGFDHDPAFDPDAESSGVQALSRQERLRSLSPLEQLKVARKGELADRVMVERLYGKQVWEALLQNPRISLPEVARIARKGSVPRPLLEQIWENAAWTREPSVRRALLGNPKITGDAILKLLRQTPKHELKLLEKTTAYPNTVRETARKLLRE